MPVPPLDPVDNGIPAREYFPSRDHSLVLDVGRWKATGHAHLVPLRAGLADTLAWFLARDAISFRPVPLEMA